MPLKMREVAEPIDLGGTSRTAKPAAIAHTPPIPMPTSTRATTITAKFGVHAASRFPTARTAISAHSTVRRSNRPSRGVRSGADTAPTSPVMVSVSPAVPSDTSRASPTGVSRPTGSISDVTTVNVAAVTAATPGRPRVAARSGTPPVPTISSICAMAISQPAPTCGNNGRSLILR